MILNKLVVTQQQQTLHEEQRTAKAAEELDARQALLHQEQQQKKAAMLKSITDHREIIVTCVHMREIFLFRHQAFYSCIISFTEKRKGDEKQNF